MDPREVTQEEEGALPLAGKRFVVTGRLESLSRTEIQSKIKSLGGAVSSSVSRKTDYVVVGEEPGSKLDTANRLGVPMLDEDGFLQLIGEQ